jgi:ribosomal protein S18 acetylase RimI-like enzyme
LSALFSSSQTSFNRLLYSQANLTVRVAEPSDVIGIVNLITTSFQPQNWLMRCFFPLVRLGLYEDLRHALRSPGSKTSVHLVALLTAETHSSPRSRMVGTVEITLRPSAPISWGTVHYPYLSNLAVCPDYRRRGVAQELLRACEAIVQDLGHQNLYLHVLENNHSAKRLYSHAGYQLHQTDPIWSHLFLHQPRRLLLHKSLGTPANPQPHSK